MVQQKKSADIDRLGKWSNAVLDYLLTKEPSSGSTKCFKTLVPELVESGDLQGLKSVFGDLREFVGLLPPEVHLELDQYLREKTGRGLFDEIRNTNKRIALILRRGKIVDADEYRTLMDRLNDTNKTGRKTEALNRLVGEYERSIQ